MVEPIDTTRYEARIREMDRALAPGSETILLGYALEDLAHTPEPDACVAWWVGAYTYLEWAEGRSDAGALDHILHGGDDLTDWMPPYPKET